LPKLATGVQSYVEKGQLAVLNIYLDEAHAEDQWALDSNKSQGICFKQTSTIDTRREVATKFVEAMKRILPIDIPMFIDDPVSKTMQNEYEALPERLVLLDTSKSGYPVVFFSMQGPFQYDVQDLMRFLEARL